MILLYVGVEKNEISGVSKCEKEWERKKKNGKE